MMLIFFVLLASCGSIVDCSSSSKKNVLLLVADDLRPELGAYGQSWMQTPCLDSLAKESLVFDAAFSNFAICSPSRNSFLSGRMPDATRTWNFIDDFRSSGRSRRSEGANWTSLPQFFKLQGYETLGHGKLYHPNKPPDNDPASWTVPYVELTSTSCSGGLHYCPTSGMPENSFSDFNTTLAAIGRLPPKGKQWFLGLGLHFPHLSWATPQWCSDLYADDDLAVSAARNAPIGVPDVSFTAEIDGATHIRLKNGSWSVPIPGNNSVPPEVDAEMRLGYYSAVTHTDWLFGKILAAADSQKNETLVVVTSDHGYSLGEHGEWAKHSLFDNALRVPLIIRAPWIDARPRRTSSFFELIDLYRTMVSLAGFDSSLVEEDVDGIDQSPVVYGEATSLRQQAYAQYSRCPRQDEPAWYLNDCERIAAENITVMGFTLRTRTRRFSEWYSFRNCTPDFTSILATELYDQQDVGAAGYNTIAAAAERDEEEEEEGSSWWSSRRSVVGSDTATMDFDQGTRINVARLYQEDVSQYRDLLRKRFDRSLNFGCPGESWV